MKLPTKDIEIPANFARQLLTPLLVLALSSSVLAQDENPEGPERWEKSITAFEARDTQSPPPDDVLLFVGSSSIRMWDLKKSWPKTNSLNNGFGGSTLADSIYYFDRLIALYDPSAIMIYAGDNDIAGKKGIVKGLSAKETAADFEKLANLIEEKFPEVPVIYIAIKPSKKRWDMWPTMEKANKLIAKRCKKDPQLYFADIAAPMLEGAEGAPGDDWFIEDGLHLSASGYTGWTEVINASLREAGVID